MVRFQAALEVLSLTLFSLIDIVYCQGGGGGVGGGAGGGAFIGILAIAACVYYCCRCCTGKPRRSNPKFVGQNVSINEKTPLTEVKFFESGYWTARYYQYEKWHGPFDVILNFNDQNMNITGTGSDNIGTYTMDGLYSYQSRRIALTKTYQLDTGCSSENLGHSVTIQLEWNSNLCQFEGKWYVRTSKYCGEDKYELKFCEPPKFDS